MRIIILIILTFWLISCGNENNLIQHNETNSNIEKLSDSPEYHSDQCEKWQMMWSWDEYADWTIKVNNCINIYTCPTWKKMTVNCWDLLEYISCTTVCVWDSDSITEWF